MNMCDLYAAIYLFIYQSMYLFLYVFCVLALGQVALLFDLF